MRTRGDMVLAAMQYYGAEAIPGGESNPLVLGFFQRAGRSDIKNDDTPWCSAFLIAIARHVGLELPATLAASSWLGVGQEIAAPRFGDVVVFDWQQIGGTGGHVGLVVARYPGHLFVLGGNQDNRVEIAYFKDRCVAGFRRILSE